METKDQHWEPPFSASAALIPASSSTPSDDSTVHLQRTVSLTHQGDDESFSTAYYTEGKDYRAMIVEDDISTFLHHDLDVRRLNYIHKMLWLAGRPMHYFPLHRQRMMKREVMITEQADLHLTWSSATVFIKPFPRYLGNHEFWLTHLCESQELYQSACGFLYSYTWLVQHESDFNIAQEMKLIPPMHWKRWKVFIQNVRKYLDERSLDHMNRRYIYGELRVGRLNWIYRFAGPPKERSFIRGYHYNYRTYSSFFVRQFAWIFAVFAYFTIVLDAMQVGLATDRLQPTKRFQDVSYGFTVFTIITPMILVGIASITFFGAAAYNLSATYTTTRRLEFRRDEHEKAESPPR